VCSVNERALVHKEKNTQYSITVSVRVVCGRTCAGVRVTDRSAQEPVSTSAFLPQSLIHKQDLTWETWRGV